jgi:hypothetical protein
MAHTREWPFLPLTGSKIGANWSVFERPTLAGNGIREDLGRVDRAALQAVRHQSVWVPTPRFAAVSGLINDGVRLQLPWPDGLVGGRRWC